MSNSASKYFSVVAIALLAAGCGSGGPRVYKAVGTVTYKSQPVEGATVNFIYDNGQAAGGTTDAAGKFELFSLGRTGGAIAGKGTFTVTKVDKPAGGAAPVASGPPKLDPSKMSPDELKKLSTIPAAIDPNSAGGSPPAQLLPAKYADPKNSGLQNEVKANNNNNFTLDLKD